MMTYRIISGRWKGKKIAAPKEFVVRPTTDFAKEALFSILKHRYNVESLSVLDLFAGIGSISFEFASRGCEDITSIEMNRKHCSFIITKAKELELDQQIRIINADVFAWLKKNRNFGKQYDLIFADPPYDFKEKQYQDLIEGVLGGGILSENGVFILEHSSKDKWEHPAIVEDRKYGHVDFSFFQNKTEESEEASN